MAPAQLSPARRTFAILFLLGAIVFAVPAAGALLLGASARLQVLNTVTVQLASFAHFGIIGWALALVLALASVALARRRLLTLLTLPLIAGLVWQLSWLTPYVRADPIPDHAEPMTVAAINIEHGEANLDQFEAHTAAAEVVVVIEITDAVRARLVERGFGRSHPHQVHLRTGIHGTSIYSRFPLDDLGAPDTVFASPLVRVHHSSGPIVVMGVHPINPMGGKTRWLQEAERLRAYIEPHLDEPLVLAGDFNSIDRHITMRRLVEGDGLRSTAALTGDGAPRTWPVRGPGSGLGPLIGIDHVLISPSVTALSHQQFRIDDTDHEGLLVTVAKRV
ncbi:MAG: endonuclease/exonuclease/phosphatase family protein [Propionibacteriaceae bacterium]|nr:endonuclease/exonuclease/phosphatase family protein [Propionibacteriaceae bacterium]